VILWAKLLERGWFRSLPIRKETGYFKVECAIWRHGWRDGCLIQITAQSLLGVFGHGAKRFAGSLLKDDLVHFVASDAHDCVRRPPRLDEAYQLVCRGFGGATRPATVVFGESWESIGRQPDLRWMFSGRSILKINEVVTVGA